MTTPTQAQQNLYLQFLAAGVPAGNAAAAVGVLSAESTPNLNTGAQGNPGTDASGVLSNGQGAFGIGSWNGSRQTDLQNYANSTGQDVNSLTTQGNFFLNDLQTNYPGVYSSLMSGSTNAADLTNSLVTVYENPAAGNVAGEIAKAGSYASGLTGGSYMSLFSGDPAAQQYLAQNAGSNPAGATGTTDTAINSTIGDAAASTVGASATGIIALINNYFTRGAVIGLGVILILGALYMFGQKGLVNAI